MVKIQSIEELKSDERYHMMSVKELESLFDVDIRTGHSTNKANDLLIEESNKKGKTICTYFFKEILKGFIDYFSIVLWITLVLYILLYKPFEDHDYDYPNHLISIAAILVCLLINSITIGLQEYQSVKLIKNLQSKNLSQVSVLRNSQWEKIKACDLVKGDVIEINANENVPVDIRLIYVDNLSFDKSILTGIKDFK